MQYCPCQFINSSIAAPHTYMRACMHAGIGRLSRRAVSKAGHPGCGWPSSSACGAGSCCRECSSPLRYKHATLQSEVYVGQYCLSDGICQATFSIHLCYRLAYWFPSLWCLDISVITSLLRTPQVETPGMHTFMLQVYAIITQLVKHIPHVSQNALNLICFLLQVTV